MSMNSGSDSDLPEGAAPKSRGMVCMFTWPCPREYPSELAARRKSCFLKPEDVSKPELLAIFKEALRHHQLLGDLLLWVAVSEKHKRYNKASLTREMHYHVVMKLRSTFAHAKLKETLARKGIRGEFTFQLVGLAANLMYILRSSSRKPPHEIDPSPEIWPPSTKLESLMNISPQQAARNNMEVDSKKPQKQRTRLTGSEVTDLFVEHSIVSTKGAWQLAKRLKIDGQPQLWETLFAVPSVAQLMAKFLEAWHERPASGTLLTTCEFPLSSFFVPRECEQWLQADHQTKTLIIHGLPKRGKTELACALMLRVRPGGYHFLNTTDDLRRVEVAADEGLVIDETLFRDHSPNDCKSWCDLKKQRFTQARNSNGRIPQGTPRIFTTNYSWQEFWPPGLLAPDQIESIQRRVLWLSCSSDLRKLAPAIAAHASGDQSRDGASSSGAPSESANLLLRMLSTLSPGTKQKVTSAIHALDSCPAPPTVPTAPASANREPEEAEEEDVFGHGGSLD